MAATLKIIKSYGAGQTEVEVTSPGLLSTDDNTAPASSPVTKPPSGTEYSYECWVRFELDVEPDTQVTNFQFWSDGTSVGTGLVITVNTDAVSAYDTPIDTVSDEGTRASFATRDSGSKISLAGTLATTGDQTDFMVFQLEVADTASAGAVTYTTNFSYDET